MKRNGLLLMTLWALLLGAFTNGVAMAVIPPAAATDTLQQEAARGGYRLITADELWAMHAQNPANLLVVDTRQEWEYAAGHIEGAVNFPMEPSWLARLTKRGQMEQFLGLDKDKQIVFY